MSTKRRASAAVTDRPGFAAGWDRQDRWLRFVEPTVERTYREAMTPATRRRFWIVCAVGGVMWAIQPVLTALLLGVPPTPTLVVGTLISMAMILVAMVSALRIGLPGIWGWSCALYAVSAIGVTAAGVEGGTSLQYSALAMAAVGIFLIAWVRVAWWVAAAICVFGVALFVGVSLALGGGGASIYQAVFMAAALGSAAAGSWFLESSERRAFVQGLLVDHLYQRVDRLFRQYLSPDVAQALVDDPGRAELGGEVVEVSVLFADLRGYTPFSERTPPDDVVAMLNAAFGAAVPAVLAEGGTIVQFVGDALMAIFNAPLRQPDHAIRACRAGLALQRATPTGPTADGRPRFRVGINTGPALVGNIGSAELHNFSALGDTTNVAARLQTYAPEGSVVIGERTHQLVCDLAAVRALGAVELKGKSAPTPVFELVGLRDSVASG